ncbi:uncharacterized protein [Mytilus edulis]|uniref:uncharacterized protein n=1 Tax=Mytilus edulis TaxID=6550 RepID=UPI0039F08AF1
MMNNIRDNLTSSNNSITITSGSLGEGLEMLGSDLDQMSVNTYIEASEDTNINFNVDTTYFTTVSEDTSPSFTKLRLLHSNGQSRYEECEQIGHDYYLLNASIKQVHFNDIFSNVHGPCVSDKHGLFDFAVCFRSKSWITPANQWITRSNNGWPDYDVKQYTVKHGPRFVPIESHTRNASIALYHNICQNIVGTEDHVKAIRMMNAVRDNLQSNKYTTIITSGSFGEGLDMQGSDIDVVLVMNYAEVCEGIQVCFDADKIYLTTEADDTQPGFTKLRVVLVHINGQVIFKDRDKIGSDYYFFNSNSFKQKYSDKLLSTVHGPCVSDTNGIFDLAYCIHSKLWVKQANQWKTRSKNVWPTYDVKQAIVNHGVLFVPVGVKGSTEEELEWRISFSVGEKLLIYTFTHTQLLCYALMKILLKDVIALDKDCKELLSSYVMKTVMFWMSEELPSSIWKPENLISCFMRCFRRLIYYVQYLVCPQYFIPENNLFENKMKGQAQEILFKKLNILKSNGWKCILLSKQISNFNALADIIRKKPSCLQVYSVKQLLSPVMDAADSLLSKHTLSMEFEKAIHWVLSTKSSKIKYLYTHFMSKYCQRSHKLLPFDDKYGTRNKSIYKQRNSYICTLLLNTRYDAVSGWLLLASLFYRTKQYNIALFILRYSLSKCTIEKIYRAMNLSHVNYEAFDVNIFRKMPIVQMEKLLLLNRVKFVVHSKLIPDELQIEVDKLDFPIPPVDSLPVRIGNSVPIFTSLPVRNGNTGPIFTFDV